MAKPFRPKPTSIAFTFDPVNNPLPPVRADQVVEYVPPAGTQREEISPFDKGEPGVPAQELCIMAFPVATYKAITDEANKRGLSFNQAVQQAFNAWISKG